MLRLASTYAAVGLSVAAAYLAGVHGDHHAAAIVAAVAVLFVALRLSFGDVLRLGALDADRVKVKARQLGTLAAVSLVVTTVATSGVVPGASPVGDASAEWVDCSLSDPLLGAAFNTLTGTDTGCRWESGEQIDYENVSKTDAYASALGIADASESYTTTTSNFLEDTRSVAWSKAKITIVNELNNGSTVSQAKVAANQTVAEYYTGVQRNVIADWNAKTYTLGYLHTESGLALTPDGFSHITEWDNKTYTLSDGSTQTLRAMDYSTNGDYHVAPETTIMPRSTADPGITTMGSIQAEDPSDGSTTHVLSAVAYAEILDNTYNQSNQIQANVDEYADDAYAQYQAGDINTSDLLDPTTIASQAATDYNSTGYYSFAAVQLASLGASGDLNASHTIETGDGTTLNGTLYYTGDDAPAGGWVTNETYTVSNFSGTFYVAAQQQDGNGSIVDLSTYENFTIVDAVNTRTGESLNATQPETYIYDSTNASALADEIDRLRDLRAEYEQAGGSGGGGGIGIGTEDRLIIAGAIVALILVATRN
ncbi:hypothetical protein [Haloferax volcanii]|uniref:Envelope protein N-terminal domain-containing protein n=3 Tax=Haloferax volcanii TaxID=2246 RepID=D4GZQ1_HALVD|nr:hypothetical protein [Haloferax volcanii]ADE03515.1 hypothetical protein HVO_0271 [Haloferax volcanii DS2]ELY23307.1 hypothetical protein C498_19619 [Haloferax volcanii DS2]MBS8121259.1 hypothetical protein [Haloferax volcanii]MBS8126267.1 hypothetical protein [Haloferax volcanii]MBS8130137.1 hypothetical protein [Haloferax volcanii]